MFQIQKIDQHLIQFTDIAGTYSFLVIGEQKAAMLDTGIGCGSLLEQVRRLTDLPIEVFITHGHVDHAMGAGEFQDVWMNPLDEALYREHSSTAIRLDYIKSCAWPGKKLQVTEKDLKPVKPFEQFHLLSTRDTFDLGGITLEIHEGAGHTPGCVTVLIPELRTLLLGDACNEFTFLFDESCSTVAEYREMLFRLDRVTHGRYDKVLVCHGPDCLAPVELLNSVIAVCDDVLHGNSDAVPIQIPIKGLHSTATVMAKAMDDTTFTRIDGGSGNIVYNPRRIR